MCYFSCLFLHVIMQFHQCSHLFLHFHHCFVRVRISFCIIGAQPCMWCNVTIYMWILYEWKVSKDVLLRLSLPENWWCSKMTWRSHVMNVSEGWRHTNYRKKKVWYLLVLKKMACFCVKKVYLADDMRIFAFPFHYSHVTRHVRIPWSTDSSF